MMLFCLGAARDFGERVARLAGLGVAPHEERTFEDGEFKIRPLASVRGERVLVCASLCPDARESAADKLLRLLVFVGAVKDAGAASVQCLLPYLAFARKDRRTKPQDPITTRYVAEMFEAVGTDGVVALEVHNVAAFENAFRRPTVHLEAAPLLARHFAGLAKSSARTVVLAPDAGAVKRARAFAKALEASSGRAVELAFLEKSRSEGLLSGDRFAGDVAGAAVIVVDDLVSSGSTLVRACEAALERGAAEVHAAVAHGSFSPGAEEVLGPSAFASIVVTDSVPDVGERCQGLKSRLVVVGAAEVFAEALQALN
ncbi:MAG TPA: ribose-phosphate diphosphokinase [Gammaproteobacteria bacterium]|nr:ribose-phosphate diphosphokinase [Gammaproteobacteria bacterium]